MIFICMPNNHVSLKLFRRGFRRDQTPRMSRELEKEIYKKSKLRKTII